MSCYIDLLRLSPCCLDLFSVRVSSVGFQQLVGLVDLGAPMTAFGSLVAWALSYWGE